MRINNPEIWELIKQGIGLRLNLGAGERRKEGYFSVDHLELPGIDVMADLNQPLSELPDNSVEAIFTRHTLEHISEFLPLMGELHRVVRANGRIEIIVPHFSNPYGYSDPTHVRFFGLYTFFYLSDPADQPRRKVPAFYATHRFQVESIQFKLVKPSFFLRLFVSVLQKYINGSINRLDWFERTLCRQFPVESVRYLLRLKKSVANA